MVAVKQIGWAVGLFLSMTSRTLALSTTDTTGGVLALRLENDGDAAILLPKRSEEEGPQERDMAFDIEVEERGLDPRGKIVKPKPKPDPPRPAPPAPTRRPRDINKRGSDTETMGLSRRGKIPKPKPKSSSVRPSPPAPTRRPRYYNEEELEARDRNIEMMGFSRRGKILKPKPNPHPPRLAPPSPTRRPRRSLEWS